MKVVGQVRGSWPSQGADDTRLLVEEIAAVVESTLSRNRTTFSEGIIVTDEDVLFSGDPNVGVLGGIGFIFAIVEADDNETLMEAHAAAREHYRWQLRVEFGKTEKQQKMF
jgi:hypothetical protein